MKRYNCLWWFSAKKLAFWTSPNERRYKLKTGSCSWFVCFHNCKIYYLVLWINVQKVVTEVRQEALVNALTHVPVGFFYAYIAALGFKGLSFLSFTPLPFPFLFQTPRPTPCRHLTSLSLQHIYHNPRFVCCFRSRFLPWSPEACLTVQLYETENVLLHRGKL